ncbi:MAG: hypothetical protein K2L21_09555 [Muribaculaceae bacterium]|nr:hypothetical protein [Muribaculaceae bacterium]
MKTRCYILLWVLLTGLGTGLWIGCTWPVIDDLAYLHRVVEADYWAVGGGLIESGADLWQSITAHYTMVNSRLANLLALAVLQLPRVAQAALCGAAAAAMLWALTALGGSRRRLTAPAAAALMWIALPWHDGLASVDFEINYVWASALALWALVATVRLRRCSGAAFAAAMAGAFAAGWMHEGIAVMMVAYMAGVLWRGAASRRTAAWLLAAAVAGFAVNIAGATTTRALTVLGAVGGPDGMQWLRTATVQMWPLWLAAAGAFVLRKRINPTALMPAAIAAAAGLAMCAVLRATGRAAWGVNLAAIIMLLMELQCTPRCAPRRLAATGIWCTVVVYALWFLHLAAWQTRISAEEHEMARQAAAGADTLRVDLTPQHDIPFTLMGIVQHPPLMNRDYNSVYARHYTGRDGIAAVPAAASGKVPGSNPFSSAGWAMLCGDTSLPDTIALRITYGPLRAAATVPDRLAALLAGHTSEYSTEALAVRGHAPGIYFIEGAGRFSRGRAIKNMSITTP